jgi:hypothetical protein
MSGMDMSRPPIRMIVSPEVWSRPSMNACHGPGLALVARSSMVASSAAGSSSEVVTSPGCHQSAEEGAPDHLYNAGRVTHSGTFGLRPNSLQRYTPPGVRADDGTRLEGVDSPLRRLDGVVDESTLVGVRFDDREQEVELRLAILAAPSSSAGSVQPTRTFALRGVGRIAAWLCDLKGIEHPASKGFPGFGHPHWTYEPVQPPVPISSLTALAGLINDAQPSLYWLPTPIFDAPEEPEWLAHPSIDVEFGRSAAHTIHLWIDQGPILGVRNLNLFISFDKIQIRNEDGESQSVDQVADAVAAWWHAMSAGDTGGQFGIVPAAPIVDGG